MKVSQYRYKKDQLMLQIRSLEPVVEMLRSENMGVQVANVRNSLHFSLPGHANEWYGSYPLSFGEQLFYEEMGKCV